MGVSAIEVHDPIGAAAREGSIFRRLFVLSLVIHAFIVFATMWTSPFGEERSAGGTDDVIPLDGISVEIVDSLPGDGAAIPAPVSLGTLLDADDATPAPVNVATATNAGETAEPETTVVTEEGLTAAAEALASPAKPVMVDTARTVGETPGTPAPDADAQLEIDTPSFAVAASSVASARRLTIESVIAASETETAAKLQSPGAAAVVAPAETAATSAPTATASARTPDDAETIANSPAAAPPLAGAFADAAALSDVAAGREATSAANAAAVAGNDNAQTIANNVAALPAAANSVAAAETPAVPAAATAGDAVRLGPPELVEPAPSQSADLAATPSSAETPEAGERQALDSPRAVPAQTASASAPQTAVATAERPHDIANPPAREVTRSAVAAPPVVDTTLSAPLSAAVNQPVEQASAGTTAAPDAVAIAPAAGDPNFDAIAAEPGIDTGAVAAVAPIAEVAGSPPAAPAPAAESDAPQSTAAAPAATTDAQTEAAPQTAAPPTPETDQSLQSDPLNLVDAPLPRPRPNIDVAGLDQDATPADAAAPKPKAITKPPRTAAKPAANSIPLLGGILSPSSVAQTGGKGPTEGVSGSGGTNRDAQGRASASSYQATIFAHLRQFRSYPPEARRQGIKGTATVTFTVNASGALLSATLSNSSGAAILDREALAMVRRASPFPPIPAGLRQSQTTIRAPIRFDIR